MKDPWSGMKFSPEGLAMAAEERNLNFSDLIEHTRGRVKKDAQDEKLQTIFIGSGLRDRMLARESEQDKIEEAKKIIKNERHLIPKDIRGDEDDSVAYVIALAEEFDKPEYRN